MAVSAAVAVGIAVGFAPPLAHADKMDETLEFSFHTRVSSFNAGRLRLRSAAGGPALPADAGLAGRVVATSPMLRANMALQGVRFGVGAGFEGYEGLRLRYRSAPGLDVADGRGWGIPIEGFVGYAFEARGRVRPFVEARAAATFFGARSGLRHAEGLATEVLRLRATSIGVGARVGVLVELNEYFFLDAGVGRVFLGTGAWTACLGIGIPIPLDNL